MATVFIFLCSFTLKNSSMYDPYWSVKPGVFAVILPMMMAHGEFELLDWLMVGGMMAYALRLTTNFYRDWPGLVHEDWRYHALQKRTGAFYWLVSLTGIHIFPTIQVFLGCLPAIMIMGDNRSPDFPAVVALGAVVLWDRHFGLRRR